MKVIKNKKALKIDTIKLRGLDEKPQFIAPLGSRNGLNEIMEVKIVTINPKIRIGINPNQGEI